MLHIKQIFDIDIDSCFELDSNSICLWTKDQWKNEFRKKGTKVFALFLSEKIIGVSVINVIIDEAQINFFSIDQKYRRNGYGSYLMRFMIKKCNLYDIKKLLLEVSDINSAAKNFYKKFNFLTVGKRKNYYKNGSDAVLKEKILIK